MPCLIPLSRWTTGLTLTVFLAAPLYGQTFSDATHLLPGLNGNVFAVGASMVDVNNDGLVDLYRTGRFNVQRPDHTFEDRLAAMGLMEEGTTVFGGLFGDYDNDGFLDVFFEDLTPPSLFYRNLGGEAFAPANEQAGLMVPALTQGSVWGDFNADGRLDLFVGSDDGDNLLYLNEDFRRFRDATAGANVTFIQHTYGAAAADYDADGDLDVYIAACSGSPEESVNVLLRNNGDGTFTDTAFNVGVDDNLAAWGVVWFDVDNDGWMDLYIGNMPMSDGRVGYNKLYWNDRQGLFLDIARTAGVQGDADDATIGVVAADFDNDGWQDLVVANQASVAYLYRNQGDYTFTKIPLGIVEARSVIAAGDVNDDGWVDLYMPRSDRRLRLNDGGVLHWIKVKTRGKAANHFGVGARIDVYAGNSHQVREITAGDGMTSQNHDLTAHFGLGLATKIDSLVVRWPHGAVDRVTDIAVDQTITLVEGIGINQAPAPFRLLEPADASVVTEGTVTLRWEAPADEEGEALVYTVHLVEAGTVRTVTGLTEPTLALDATEVPEGEGLAWTVTATDGHSLRGSLDRFTLVRTTVTAAEDEVPAASPAISNAPNPFREATTIRFGVPAAAPVALAVYDLMGRRVRMLASGWHATGDYAQAWDGRDGEGKVLAPGVYMIRLQAGASVHTHPVVLVR